MINVDYNRDLNMIIKISAVMPYVLNLGHTPVLGHFVSAQQDIR